MIRESPPATRSVLAARAREYARPRYVGVLGLRRPRSLGVWPIDPEKRLGCLLRCGSDFCPINRIGRAENDAFKEVLKDQALEVHGGQPWIAASELVLSHQGLESICELSPRDAEVLAVEVLAELRSRWLGG